MRRALGLYLHGRRTRRVLCYPLIRELVAEGTGLEVGGPSDLFARGQMLPLYPAIRRLDNCNFSQSTVWEGAIEEGETFVYDRRRAPGRQYILEATDLTPIADGSYDVVLSSHTLEHTANPLRALAEWSRVLRDGGTLVLVVPHKEATFDHRRPVTSLQHLVDDYERGTTEEDQTHLAEVLALHDLELDQPAGDSTAFAARSRQNAENRCLHHHVFDTRLAVATVDRARLQILAVEPTPTEHIIVVARKAGGATDNTRFLGPEANWRGRSPFELDRLPPQPLPFAPP